MENDENGAPRPPVNPERELVFAGETSGTARRGGGEIAVIVRMVLVLALAALAVYGVVYFLRRSTRPQTQRNPYLKILTSAHLGSSRFLYVVSVGSRAWLIGAGEGGVNLLAEIDDREAIDAMLLEESRRAGESAASRFADFRSLLRRLGGAGRTIANNGAANNGAANNGDGNNGDGNNGGAVANDAEFSPGIIRQQRKRIREL